MRALASGPQCPALSHLISRFYGTGKEDRNEHKPAILQRQHDVKTRIELVIMWQDYEL